MSKNALWELDSAGHEHAGPDDTVKPNDVFADEVQSTRPVLVVGPAGEVTRRQVVG